MAAFVLLVGHLISHNSTSLHSFGADSSQWVLLSLAVGLLASWIRRLAADAASSDGNRSYEAAYELLSQLRTVSRQLSGGLDAGNVTEAIGRTGARLVDVSSGVESAPGFKDAAKIAAFLAAVAAA